MESAIKSGKRKFKDNGTFYLFLKEGSYLTESVLTNENRPYAVSQFTNTSNNSRASWSETAVKPLDVSKHQSKLRKRNMALAHHFTF